ncbi:MAG: CPBP family intramembrane metalloprotease, partial [Anaerolineaceae bacterium]|nr:CPBP family intramembrane metalloprotease [Anaerolineaceae bacterium]
LGMNFSIIITVVTTVVIFFQIFRNGTLSMNLFPGLLLVVIFALTNSFVEEIIYRFSFVGVGLELKISPLLIQGLAALTFGLIHYYGKPSGIPGVLLAAFIGWFLSKSMIETQGFFWAWFIHFLQDVVIFFAVFMTL